MPQIEREVILFDLAYGFLSLSFIWQRTDTGLHGTHAIDRWGMAGSMGQCVGCVAARTGCRGGGFTHSLVERNKHTAAGRRAHASGESREGDDASSGLSGRVVCV